MNTVKKILICGNKSYASLGLSNLLEEEDYNVDCFSRGILHKEGNSISGDVMDMQENEYLQSEYDVVINFVIIKNGSIQENIEYLKKLYEFCLARGVKYLFHVSSVSVYRNEEIYITERTPIESNPDNKGIYAAVKVASDLYLSQCQNDQCKVVFLRPGFIVTDEIKSPFAGIAKLLPFNYCLLMGNRETSLPFISRTKFHNKILNILKSENIQSVYLFVENPSDTKYTYVKMISERRIIPLPKFLVLQLAKVLKVLYILDENKMKQIKGLFKVNHYTIERND